MWGWHWFCFLKDNLIKFSGTLQFPQSDLSYDQCNCLCNQTKVSLRQFLWYLRTKVQRKWYFSAQCLSPEDWPCTGSGWSGSGSRCPARCGRLSASWWACPGDELLQPADIAMHCKGLKSLLFDFCYICASEFQFKLSTHECHSINVKQSKNF